MMLCNCSGSVVPSVNRLYIHDDSSALSVPFTNP